MDWWYRWLLVFWALLGIPSPPFSDCRASNLGGNGKNSETSTISSRKCRVTEFPCENGGCIPLSKYCDQKYDCSDRSDEPKLCTVCNRTLYGEVGKTYELDVRQPKELPFICDFNFTALGNEHGDIIQINFNKFNVGRFTSFKETGCHDGSMAIREAQLPTSGGVWCGTAWGFNSYYSETQSINVSLRLWRLPGGLTAASGASAGNFEFAISYKFLRRGDALLRSDVGAWMGESVPGSYCNRHLYDCDQRRGGCVIRSPNFPGIYPRNITCLYRISQRTIPNGLHAMIVLRQSDRHKLHIKDQAPQMEQNNRMLRSWEQCDLVQDYISVRDGKTLDAPEIARFCGGDTLPEIIASGPDMAIEFKTSPYDSLFHNFQAPSLMGYELEINVKYVNANSQSFVAPDSRCEFTINAFENPFGELESPRHTLPPNTLCRYYFQGRHHETVWISFLKYNSALDTSAVFEAQSDCAPQLRIWDGKLVTSNRTHGSQYDFTPNSSLLAEICREDVPKLCSRSLITKRARPCTADESYLSSGSDLTMEYKPNPSGPARLYGPVAAFRLRYEFVDTSLGGTPLDQPFQASLFAPEPAALTQSHSKSCNRLYRSISTTRGIFRSPTNVFFYGRGGSENISCTIRFEARRGESVRLTITRARFGGRSCQNVQNRSGRWHCDHHGGPVADLRIGEVPWLDVGPLPRDCICSDVSRSLILAPLAANVVEVQFNTHSMSVDQDFRDFYFEGRYEFTADGCATDWSMRRLKGRSGNASLSASECAPLIQPWLLEPETPEGYLVLKLKGFWMPTVMQSVAPCPTDARITVYSTNNPGYQRDLCPTSGNDVVAFSDGWDSAFEYSPVELSRSLVVEYRSPWKSGIDNMEYKFAWMEVYPAIGCHHKCTELQACIAPELWCDGVNHCPSGQDESSVECDINLPLSPLYVGIAAATFTLLLSLTAGLAACAKRKKIEVKQHYDAHADANGRFPPHLAAHHHHHLPPHALPPIFIDTPAKDSFC
ncbi:uncharacterized protein LOC129802670 isoform X2 [Phlebotomus papatasi]|uniref:uncharacterized protein LOC129802670 isoform X2 n=1 Tax=Phlebotomus papatasi TaxID=29031 RepID=UPI00248374C5|nr:uncharacterized protein LOC129802670 isoform X2 [Phlebotomus papatasi]XP_055704640.1 uncharacterized protein LOC129802670 isoform X2 [Phlebotomus papatasi]